MMKRIVFALLLLASCFGAYEGYAQGTNAESYTDYFKKPDNGNILGNHGVGSPDHFQESDISMLYYLSHSHFT